MKLSFYPMIAASALILSACGGGGGGATVSLMTASTDTTGGIVSLGFNGWNLSSTTAPTSTFAVTANGTAIPVTAVTVNGPTLDLALASPVTHGQTVTVTYNAPAYDPSTNNAAIQNMAGIDAGGFSNQAVTNSVPAPAAAPAVLINNAAASPNAAGEYTATGDTRITVNDSRLRGSSRGQTVDASGATQLTSFSIKTIGAGVYDAVITKGPVGGLTTVTLGMRDADDLVIKLRWQ